MAQRAAGGTPGHPGAEAVMTMPLACDCAADRFQVPTAHGQQRAGWLCQHGMQEALESLRVSSLRFLAMAPNGNGRRTGCSLCRCAASLLPCCATARDALFIPKEVDVVTKDLHQWNGCSCADVNTV